MFKMKPLQRSLAVLTLATALLPLSAIAQSKDPVRIGLLASKSGTFASQGEEVLRAIQFAIDEANAKGGVDGRKVEVQIADDEGTPEAGRRAAEKMARDGYNLLIGSIPSSISLALGQNLDRWDAMYVVIASKSDKITGDSCKSRMFRATQSDSMDIAMINEVAKTFKEKTFGVIAADYVWGRESGGAFKKAAESLGKSVPISLFVPIGTKDFSPYIAQLKAAKVDAVWTAEIGRDAIAMIKQAEEFGLIPTTKFIGHALIQHATISTTGDTLNGTTGTMVYGPEINTARNKAFVAAWKSKFNRLPTDYEGMAYNGITLIFEGVKKAQSSKPEAISKALRGAEVEMLDGKVTVRAADNQVLMPNYFGRAKKVDGLLRAVVEQTFGPEIIPAASPLCKM